jgi:2-phospho-L-lactate transferase/gluconeogenesis factor (CofD/UPF0052 family)
VVVFTGGRGSGVLSKRLLQRSDVHLVLAINGYDDGASTGEVRRYLGDALGPSDFRKNSARVADATGSCSPALIRLLDTRLPIDIDAAQASRALQHLVDSGRLAGGSEPSETPAAAEHTALADRLDAFLGDWRRSGRRFDFSDCAIGNLVFAGCFLRQGRRFNDAVDDFAALLDLPPGLIDNVTDGTNAYLVGVDVSGRVLGTEEAIVGSRQHTQIAELFLLRRPLSAAECAALAGRGMAEACRSLAECEIRVAMNERLGRQIEAADVIVYAPGTQHSSLYPSYLTTGIGDRIAANQRAIKLLVTNLEADAEIAGASAVTLVERALYYLTEKGTRPRPAPYLVTHYLLNDPGQEGGNRPYVPLGQVEAFEDPRLLRIGYFEEGITGRHDAAKILEPFIESLAAAPVLPRVGILLYDVTSVNKLIQTLLEFLRAGGDTLANVTVFAPHTQSIDRDWLARLPFPVTLFETEQAAEAALRGAARQADLDFVALFESSGMYRGEDLAGLFRHLGSGRVDAVWGSRRLSLRDIEESYRFHYFQNPIMRSISRAGSHLLSLAYLVLYGRHIADTLSGVRVVRASDAADLGVALTHRQVNQHLLSRLLRRRADVLEVPVQFISMSPERVRRTGIAEGLGSLATVIWRRLTRARRAARARS